ncbi:bifunctional diguanylate cyclase/phosphodiesterase [Massilia sp. GCM10023247]|uniref:bifunctional diguanylate cyclase/phosphodiesterase n=1 Tax=Massilia sp. GCM10023247 TaxID=3252643 RepID=UPI00360DE57D
MPGIVGVTIFLFADYHDGRERLIHDNIERARSLGRELDMHILRGQELALALGGAGELSSEVLPVFSARAAGSIVAAGMGSQVAIYQGKDGTLVPMSSAADAFLSSERSAGMARQAFRQARVLVSDVVIDPASGRSLVGSFVPVSRHGKVEYVVGIAIPTSQLSTILQGHKLHPGWLASLVDRKAVIAARSRASERFVGQATSPEMRSAIMRGDAGWVETVSKDGVPNITGFSRSPLTGFTTTVGVPRAQVIRPLQAKLAYLGATAALLFALGLLFARWVNRLISDSIHALVEPASALGQGTLLQVATVHVSEVNKVGVAIERAAALLEHRAAVLSEQKMELQQFQFFSEHSNEMMLLVDEEGRIRYANRIAAERLGYSNAELLSMTLFEIALLSTPEGLRATFDACRDARLPSFERVYRCKDGSEFPVEITATVLKHRGEWLMHVAPRDIGERRHAEQAVRWAASHDPLTGLANRTRALACLEQAIAAGRSAGREGALLYIDLDRFKPVNDLYGHEVGDRVLREVAHRMQDCMRQDQLLARVGGDEFMAVLPDGDQAGASVAATVDAIVEAVARPITIGNIEVKLSACIGISRYPEHGDSAGVLVHAADVAMLQVKNSGRGSFAFYCPEMDARAQFVLGVERRLKQALEHDGLLLHYQPIVNLASGKVEGIEALVRLADGIEPALGPAAFIPIAETCGLIAPLGEWVAQEACRQQANWSAAGLDLTVSVNVSALQFQRAGFLAYVRELIARSGIRPACLVLELTETAIMENVADAVRILQDLKALGVRIALDDFGTGYSSLSSLSSLPLDKLKIDQSFVRGIETNPANRAVIDAIIALGKSLNLELVAEGIETEAAWRYLQERGCHQGQGYHFSRPLPAPELRKLWDSQGGQAG